MEAMYGMGFDAVVNEMVLQFKGHRVLLRHKPLYNPLPKDIAGVFHGHIHNGDRAALIRAKENPDIPPYNVNCCVEVTAYQPISFREAYRRLCAQLDRHCDMARSTK
jgi:calcineurin-like phosphoesterase family protein